MKVMTMNFLMSIVAIMVIMCGTLFITHNLNENNQEYVYEITEIKGNDVFGEAITKKSKDNMGVFLYKNEINFLNPKVGDEIIVTWGENNTILDIQKY